MRAYDPPLPSHCQGIAMSKSIGVAATFALLCGGISTANADDGAWVTCKNGMQVHSGASCEQHGGVRIEMTKSTTAKPIPIHALKTPTPNNGAAAKTKTQKTASSGTSKKKTASNATRNPTAKCMDGAMYFSTQRSGACAKHGGVDKWYGF